MPAPPRDDTWLTRASEHGVLPVLAAHLESSGNPRLRAVRRLRAAHHLRCMADLRVVREAFAAAGIDWLIFKGPVLSEIVYRRPGTRGYGDLDVLVRPGDLHAAIAALGREGAVPATAEWATAQSRGLGETVVLLPNGTHLDLHWHVVNSARARRDFSLHTEALLGTAQPVRLAGMHLLTFDPVDTVLHVAFHAVKSGGDRLRWLLDLQQCMLACEVPAPQLQARARDLGVELVLRFMLNRVSMFVDERTLLDGPRPLGPAERLWLAADAAAMALRPPGSRGQGRLSAAVLANSTRGEASTSWRRFAWAVPSLVRDHWREQVAPRQFVSA